MAPLHRLIAEINVEIIRYLPRNLALYLGWRKLSPRPGIPPWDAHFYTVPGDTGGGWRPNFRPQHPNKDPQEPFGSESNSKGDEHGFNNCTMSSGALALAYEKETQDGKWGGDLRHHGNTDMAQGTDLYDLQASWAYYNEELKIKTGQGWNALVDYHNDGRAIVIQGEGQCPGSGTFTGAHACIIAPESHSNGTDWLWGDPLTNDWQWVPKAKIRDWAERFHSSIAFAVGRKFAPPAPEPVPPEPIPVPPPYYPPPLITAPPMVGWMPIPFVFGAWENAEWDADVWDINAASWGGAWA